MTATRCYELRWIGDGVAAFSIVTDEEPFFSLESIEGLRRVARAIEAARDLRAVVIEGGARQFCAGASRDTLLRLDAAQAIDALVGEAARTILSLSVPTVAAMAGHAIGGGLVIGLWCDAAIFAEESLYSANFMALGFTPGMGSTVLLPEVFGPTLARDLLLTGRAVKGAELRTLAPALSHRIVTRAEVQKSAYTLAHELAGQAQAAMRLFRKHHNAGRRALLEEALVAERRMHAEIFALDETRHRVSQSYATRSES